MANPRFMLPSPNVDAGFNVTNPMQAPLMPSLGPISRLTPAQLAQAAASSFHPGALMGPGPMPSLAPPSPGGSGLGEGMALARVGLGLLKDFLTGQPRDVDTAASIAYGSPRPKMANLGGGWIGGGV